MTFKDLENWQKNLVVKGLNDDENIYIEYTKDDIIASFKQENQQLKEKLEASEKARKEGIKYCNVVIKNVENLDLKIYPKEFYDLLSILDIDKGE